MYLKSFDELTFTDDFIFYKVMTQNEHICKKVVELCIGRAIYEFTKREKTDPSVELNDGSTCILINAYSDDSNYSYEMREFLFIIR